MVGLGENRNDNKVGSFVCSCSEENLAMTGLFVHKVDCFRGECFEEAFAMTPPASAPPPFRASEPKSHFRFYASSMGRFMKPDDIIPNAFNPQSWNLYSYVNNNPVNFNDPSGHFAGGFGGGITRQMMKREYFAPPSGTAWELTAVEYMTFIWTKYYSITITKDMEGNVLSISEPKYLYSMAGYASGSFGFCAGNSGSKHFKEIYEGDPVIGKFLFQQLKTQLTEIVFSLFVDLNNPNLTYILFGYDISKDKKIDQASEGTVRSVWYDSVRFALKGIAIWIAFGHVEPGAYFSNEKGFNTNQSWHPECAYHGSGFAGSEQDVRTYLQYYNANIRDTLRVIFVILYGESQWFKFTP